MATAVLFIGWSGLRAGLSGEDRAYIAAYALRYLHSLRVEGCERVEAASTTGSAPKGRAFLFGDRAALDRLARSDAFRAFLHDLSRYFEQVAVTPGIPRDSWSRRPTPRSAVVHSTCGA
jgi:hypothetical protein